MARAYSGMLGSLALCLVILRGIFLGLPANHILTTGLVVFSVFAVAGFFIGSMAERSIEETSGLQLDERVEGTTLAASIENEAKPQKLA